MLDLENKSNRNMALFFRSELTKLTRGLKIHRTTIKVLRRKGLITQRHRNTAFKLTALAQRLLEEAKT